MSTGSLINNVMGEAAQVKPVPGMGATRLMYTDRKACTIAMVSSLAVWVREDKVTRTDSNGMSESQEYAFAPNNEAPLHEYSLRKNGQYVRVGQPMRTGERLLIGHREHYHDFSF
jgi:hypothetical protein